MKIAFRADASIKIGSGHVMRCLTLADRLRAQGNETLFIARDYPGNMGREIERRGHTLCRLPVYNDLIDAQGSAPTHAAWLGADYRTDAEECISALADWEKADWIVVDHYGIDHRWETLLGARTRKIMVIDDLADRPHQCDLLLDQNLQSQSDRYSTLLPASCKCLLGPRFALLRPEFNKLRERASRRDGQVNRLLVFLGGGDPSNDTTTVLKCIVESGVAATMSIDVVIGGANPHRSKLETVCQSLKHVQLHVQTPDMAELMDQADLMIGAPGASSWERCCMGLPSILLSVAANQIENGLQIARYRAAIYLGDASVVSTRQLARVLKSLTSRPKLMRQLARRALRIADGEGTSRVVLAMSADEIQIRSACLEDCETVWRWRNDPRTRKNAFDSQAIDLEVHRTWFHHVMQDPQRELLIGSISGQDVGVLRFDVSGDTAEISVYLDPELHGLGLGSQLISAGGRWAVDNALPIKQLIARVRPENAISFKAFRQAGYRNKNNEPVLFWQTTT